MRFVKLTEAELITLQQDHKNGSQFQFRDRCFCLILSHQGKSVTEPAQLFEVSRITVYSWFDAWETNGIGGLMNRKGQGRKPILSQQNPQHVEKVEALIAGNPQSVKSVVAEIEPVLGLTLHPETLKRFLKNLVSAIQSIRTRLKARQVATEREAGEAALKALSQLAATKEIDLYFGGDARRILDAAGAAARVASQRRTNPYFPESATKS